MKMPEALNELAAAYALAADRALARARDDPRVWAMLPAAIRAATFRPPAGPCPDQAIATVELTDEGFRFVIDDQRFETLCRESFEPVDFDEVAGWTLGEDGLLIVILESPHTEEFDLDGIGIGPAQGTTGRNFGQHLCIQHRAQPGLLRAARKRYRVVLMNAIQYQCSLGAGTRFFRDLVFRGLWPRLGREDFVDRLRRYVGGVDDVLILNCCSKGASLLIPSNEARQLDELRTMVQHAAGSVIPEDRLFMRPHPSSAWFWRSAR